MPARRLLRDAMDVSDRRDERGSLQALGAAPPHTPSLQPLLPHLVTLTHGFTLGIAHSPHSWLLPLPAEPEKKSTLYVSCWKSADDEKELEELAAAPKPRGEQP